MTTTVNAWTEIAELGWTSISVPEERGAAGYTTIETLVAGGDLLGGPDPAATEAVYNAAEAVQLPGGLGFTEEHDIGLYHERALVGVPTQGRPPAHLGRIAEGLNA
jgi:alkylation response protein AidB-like acyl-CoA dehydrogenase